ncbi:MAG: glycerol-3-phosphate dehydrogenase [NAD(P)+] [Candidatus Hepatoplasma vulgare]|nr:MAG: glycerol-3-phosphate dehydrogenase [NAD(P)+] [Candidatus Hepatoplasma sp.]
MESKLLRDKITIFGSGAFGTAMAYLLSKKNNYICIYGIDEDEVNDILNNHKNSKIFEKILPSSITATTDMKEALKDAKIIMIATPSFAVRDLLKRIVENLDHQIYIINLSKGYDLEKNESLSSLIYESIPSKFNLGVIKLSGPSYASEIIRDEPTIFNFASLKKEVFEKLNKYFNIEKIKLIYTSELEGVELLSVLKNVYAIVLGINKGLGYGKNAEALLFYQILEEMKLVLKTLKVREELAYTVSGLWDLYLTGTSRTSRNFNSGFLIGENNKVNKEIFDTSKTTEGIISLNAMNNFLIKNKLHLLSFELLYKIIYEKSNPKEAFKIFYQTYN